VSYSDSDRPRRRGVFLRAFLLLYVKPANTLSQVPATTIICFAFLYVEISSVKKTDWSLMYSKGVGNEISKN